MIHLNECFDILCYPTDQGIDMKTNYLPMGRTTVNSENETCQIYNMEVFSSKIHGLQKHDSVAKHATCANMHKSPLWLSYIARLKGYLQVLNVFHTHFITSKQGLNMSTHNWRTFQHKTHQTGHQILFT